MSATSTSGPGKPGLDSPLFPLVRGENSSFIDNAGQPHAPRMVTHVHGHLVQYNENSSAHIPINTIPNTLITPERVEIGRVDIGTNTDSFSIQHQPFTQTKSTTVQVPVSSSSSLPVTTNVPIPSSTTTTTTASTGTNTEPYHETITSTTKPLLRSEYPWN